MGKSLVLLTFNKLSWKRENKLLEAKAEWSFTGAVKTPWENYGISVESSL